MRKRTKNITEKVELSNKERQGNIVYGVAVLGRTSKNGRVYPEEIMKQALPKYENCRVFLDHPNGNEKRSIKNLFGKIINPRIETSGVVADLMFNEGHEFAPTFVYMLENLSDIFGLSHSCTARTEMLPDSTERIVDIVDIESVDIVAQPATNQNIFESYTRLLESVNMKKKIEEGDGLLQTKDGGVTPSHLPEMCDSEDGYKAKMKEEMGKILANEGLGSDGKIDALMSLFPKVEAEDKDKDDKKEEAKDDDMDDKKEEAETDKDDDVAEGVDDKKKAEESILRSKSVGLKLVLEELESYRLADKMRAAKVKAETFCAEKGLSPKLITESFVDVLMSVPESKWGGLVNDRIKISTPAKSGPVSVSGKVAAGANDLTVDSLTKALFGK